MEKIICPSCGFATTGAKFCSECGAFLNRDGKKEVKETVISEVIDATNIPIMKDFLDSNCVQQKKKNTSVSDKNLEMLINTCRKTMATIGGDGYTEYVLYKRDETSYELHYYSKYQSMPEEVHLAYKSDKSIMEEAYQRINSLHLDDYENKQGDGLEGGMRILKYKRGDKFIRLTNDNLPLEKHSYLYEIECILVKTANDENRLD